MGVVMLAMSVVEDPKKLEKNCAVVVMVLNAPHTARDVAQLPSVRVPVMADEPVAVGVVSRVRKGYPMPVVLMMEPLPTMEKLPNMEAPSSGGLKSTGVSLTTWLVTARPLQVLNVPVVAQSLPPVALRTKRS
jgi:hypothetical protein